MLGSARRPGVARAKLEVRWRVLRRACVALAVAAVAAPTAWADGTPISGAESPPAPQTPPQGAGGDTKASDAPHAVGASLRLPPGAPPLGGNGRLPFSQQVAIHSPRGPAYLAPNAARAWETMRQASVRELGVELYPFGPDSAYRSYGKQLEAWHVFKAGGPEAAPPGTSAHGLGKAVDLASPEMRTAVDKLGSRFGWAKTEAPSEWGHINYVGR
jgi:D-alanyl-D-alanine carboxypeptidase